MIKASKKVALPNEVLSYFAPELVRLTPRDRVNLVLKAFGIYFRQSIYPWVIVAHFCFHLYVVFALFPLQGSGLLAQSLFAGFIAGLAAAAYVVPLLWLVLLRYRPFLQNEAEEILAKKQNPG